MKIASALTGLNPKRYQKEFIKYKLFTKNETKSPEEEYFEDDLRALGSKFGCMMIVDDACELLQRIDKDGYTIDDSVVATVFYILTQIADVIL